MNAVTVAAVFETLEQDHQLVLDRVQAMEELVAALMAAPEDIDAPRVFGRLKELDDFFVTQFANHTDEEEKTLFPLLEQFPPEGTALAGRLREDHESLRRKLDEFNKCLGIALDLQDRPPRAVLRDLLVDAWELWDALDRHAHDETQGIRECLSRTMKEESIL